MLVFLLRCLFLKNLIFQQFWKKQNTLTARAFILLSAAANLRNIK